MDLRLGAGHALTGAKTLLVLLVAFLSAGATFDGSSLQDIWLVFVLPNLVWVVIPMLVCFSMGRRLLAAFHAPGEAF